MAGMVESARRLRAHGALAYLLEHEPGVVLPYLTFAEMDRVLLVAGDFAAPFFARWLEPDQASRAAEWAVRIVLTYSRTRRRTPTWPTPTTPGPWCARSSCPASSPCASTPPAPPRIPVPTQHPVPPTTHLTTHQGGSTMTTLDDDQDQLRSNLELIGRENINDLEAVLSLVGQVRRRGLPPGARQLPGRVHLGLREGRQAPARQALREGQEGAVERPDRPGLVDRGRPGEGRHGQRRGQPGPDAVGPGRPRRHRAGEVGRQGVAAVRHREPELAALAVHARRAGRAAVHGQDRRDGAVDRRQVLRRHPGDGRGPPRRGLLQVPRRQALRPLPDERAPGPPARRHRVRLPLGHDLPRHADHGRGPGPGGVRLHPHDDDRAAAQEAAALRHGRRGASCGLRCPQPAGVLQGARARPSCASARSSPSRRPSA